MTTAIAIIIATACVAIALIVAAVIIAGKQMETEPKPRRRATQEEQEEIERFLERYECCTRVINWIPIEEKKPGAYHVLVTLMHAPDDIEVCEMDYWNVTGEWRSKVIAWAEMPKPYKAKSRQ